MLIAMAVHDTNENRRSWMTVETIESLMRTVDFTGKHRLIIVDNGSCNLTKQFLKRLPRHMTVLTNDENIGTAAAINRAWRFRMPGEHCVKMDNDVVIRQPAWVDWMEDVFIRDDNIGICGLKRKDLDESPFATNDYKSLVYMLPHERGQRWLIVEQVKHVIGTCQAYSSRFLDRIGYLIQPGLYGFDDSLSAVRAKVAGFKCVFLHGFEIDHIDPGGDDYNRWKMDQANKDFYAYEEMKVMYETLQEDVYYDGGFVNGGL